MSERPHRALRRTSPRETRPQTNAMAITVPNNCFTTNLKRMTVMPTDRIHKPILLLVLVLLTIQLAGPARADIIPPGSKSVSHKLVFVDSPELQKHRLIATPVRGFQGFAEVEPGKPFPFSSKYGTRFYVVPDDFEPPQRTSPGESLPFPSCEPPVHSVTYVPLFSPTASLRSTCKLVGVSADQLQIELVEHVELDAQGRPASMVRRALMLLAIAAAGSIGCWVLWRRTHPHSNPASAS